MKKKSVKFLSAVCVLAIACCSTGCGNKETADENKEVVESSVEAVSSEDTQNDLSESSEEFDDGKDGNLDENQSAQDWRIEANIAAKGTILYHGESYDVCVCTEEDAAYLYYDKEEQELLTKLPYPDEMKVEDESTVDCDFTDLDGDGYSDPTLYFTTADGNKSYLIWFYVAEEGYVCNLEFSVLFDETGADGESLN